MYLFWRVVYWPCQASPTPSRIYLSLPWAARDNAPCSTYFACDLLALPSPIHILKDLSLPPIGTKEWRVTQYPFCMWFFGPMGNNHTYTLKDLLASCKVKGSNLTHHHKDKVITRHKDGVITNIIAQGQTYIKSSQVKCIQINSLLPSNFIRYFNNQISTIFSKFSKPFLVKIFYINFPSNKTR